MLEVGAVAVADPLVAQREGIAAPGAEGVGELVQQDSRDPGAQRRALAERRAVAASGGKGLLHDVFGGVAVAHAREGDAHQVGPQAADFGGVFGGVDGNGHGSVSGRSVR